MSTAPYLSVIVPAYNEVASIGQTLDKMQTYLDTQPYDYEIIVAADGDDGTREHVAKRMEHDERLRVIGSAERGGKGRGIRKGVSLASGTIIGFTDADNKTPIEELEKVLSWFDQGYDVVIGSRALSTSHILQRQPLYRQIGSRVFGMVMRPLVGLYDIRDTQCGFKFFQGNVAHDLFRRQYIDGYMFDVEILRLAKQSRYQIKEVAVDWQDDGDTRYNPITGTWLNARDLLRIHFAQRASIQGEYRVKQS